MRCEDCLPLVEEYFDGEVEEVTAGLMSAHLSACETCAAALDALSFEQEMYARYDRGLEVSPDLWARVSAEIARTPLPESTAPRRPFLSRAFESLAAALGVLAARPALASSLALLVVAAAAGSLWLARRAQAPAPNQVAQRGPTNINAPAAPMKENNGGGTGEGAPAVTPFEVLPASVGPRREGSRRPESIQRALDTPRTPVEDTDGAKLLADASAQSPGSNFVLITPDGHAAPHDDTAAFLNASAATGARVAADAPAAEAVEEDVARHVERAQMLLRTIKNVRASEVGAADIAYEKNLSRKLLTENATLKLEAEVKGDKDTRKVLDQIEPFLLDIANMDDQPSREEVRSLRERVRKNEIVAALEVY
jgi:hypothetical protein